ncbi:MAG: flagellar hook-length control protein FliK [Nitrospirae bacterium]|nr:flagellar hook-length control protein FliK [Nitrospirota bacterium]
MKTMLLPSIDITAGTPGGEKPFPAHEGKGENPASTIFSALLPLIMLTTDQKETPEGDGTGAEVPGLAAFGAVPEGEQKPTPAGPTIPAGKLPGFHDKMLGSGTGDAPDTAVRPDTRTADTLIGAKSNTRGKPGSAEKEAASTVFRTVEEAADTGTPSNASKLGPVTPDEASRTGNTSGHQKTSGKADLPGNKGLPAQDKGPVPDQTAVGEKTEDHAGTETGNHGSRKDAGPYLRTGTGHGSDVSFSVKEVDVPEADPGPSGRSPNAHRTEETGFTERLSQAAATRPDKPLPAHKASSIELTIEPEGLGKIDIEVSVHNGEVRAELGIERLKSLLDIQNNMPQLFDSLAKAGLTPGGFSLFLKNRGGRAWTKTQYGMKETEHIDAAEQFQKTNHDRSGLYNVSIRV